MTSRDVIFIPEPYPEDVLRSVPPHIEVRQGQANKSYTEDDLIDLLGDVTAMAITSRDHISAKVIKNAPRLRVIGKSGARPSNVDMDAALSRSIRVLWTPTANVVSVAEMTLALMLSLVKRLPELSAHVKEGGWRDYTLLGRELSSLTIGLVGLGGVGLKVAELSNAFGARVVGYDPALSQESAAKKGIEWLSLPELAAQADILSLHCELNEKTRGMINKELLSSMRDGSYLINTARGALVDEDALLDALETGRIHAAALDVFATEPLPRGHRLLTHKSVFPTPHISAFTSEAIARETSWVLEDIINALEDRPVRHGA